jgi:prevent-host-death family protein
MHDKPTVITATELQQKSGQILRRIFQDREHFIIERGGYPIAVVIPVQDYSQSISGREERQLNNDLTKTD